MLDTQRSHKLCQQHILLQSKHGYKTGSHRPPPAGRGCYKPRRLTLVSVTHVVIKVAGADGNWASAHVGSGASNWKGDGFVFMCRRIQCENVHAAQVWSTFPARQRSAGRRAGVCRRVESHSPQCTISHMLTRPLPPIPEPSEAGATEPGLHSSRGREGREGREVGGEFLLLCSLGVSYLEDLWAGRF